MSKFLHSIYVLFSGAILGLILIIMNHDKNLRANVDTLVSKPVPSSIEIPVYQTIDYDIILNRIQETENLIHRMESVTTVKLTAAKISLDKELKDIRALIKANKLDLKPINDKLIKLEVTMADQPHIESVVHKDCVCTTYCTCGCNQ